MIQAIGVEAVVEGLASFLSGMGQIKSAVESVSPETTLLGRAFSTLGDIAGTVANFIGDVLAFTLGGLLVDAIQGAISVLNEMISKTLEAGSAFQTLTLRLNGMNLDALIKSGASYDRALTQSIELTKEQLRWTQELAIATPYDNTDISNVYSLARSYGFADDQAKELTEDTANFASAMGLSNSAMERVIINFGQMKARGKITGTELKDLARGAFLPLDDVLSRIAKNMGITTEALTKKISAPGGGVDESEFFKAFHQMIEEEPRFTGAAERMARTLSAASGNAMDLVSSIAGMSIVMPIMDVLGGKVADFVELFSTTSSLSGPEMDLASMGHIPEFMKGFEPVLTLGDRLREAATSIGKSLSGIVEGALGLLPSMEGLAEGLVSAVEGFAQWLVDNKDTIIENIQGIQEFILGLGENEFIVNLIGFLGDLVAQLLAVNETTGNATWWDLVLAIGAVATAIGEVLIGFLESLGINLGTNVLSVQGLIDALLIFAQWISDNQELLTTLLQIFVALIIIQFVTTLVISLVGALISAIATFMIVNAVTMALIVVFSAVVAIIGVVMIALTVLKIGFIILGAAIAFFVALVILRFKSLYENTVQTIDDIVAAFQEQDWPALGEAIIGGIIRGIESMIGDLVAAAQAAAGAAMDAIADVLQIQSPSKVTRGFGVNIMKGLADGIISSVGLVSGAVTEAVGTMSVLAMPSMMAQYTSAAPSAISNTYQSNNSYNLAIHSNAKSEDVKADFSMLESLSGV